MQRLQARELDFFIADTRTIKDHSNLDIVPLPKQQGYFCCRTGHPLALQDQPAARDVFEYPLAVMWLPKAILQLLYKLAERELTELTDLPCGVIQCDFLKILFEVISSSNAIGVTTKAAMQDMLYEKKISLLPITVPELKTCYGLVRNTEYSLSPTVLLLQQYIIETEEQLAAAR